MGLKRFSSYDVPWHFITFPLLPSPHISLKNSVGISAFTIDILPRWLHDYFFPLFPRSALAIPGLLSSKGQNPYFNHFFLDLT